MVVSDTSKLFLYGTLLDPTLLEIVGGEGVVEKRNGTLRDHSVFWVEGETFPIVSATPGSDTDGLVIEVLPEALARLSFYELGFGYGVKDFAIETSSGPVSAAVYVPSPGTWLPGDLWSLQVWQDQHAPLAREAAAEYMRLIETHTVLTAPAAFPMIRSRAASRLRAKAAPSPEAFETVQGEVNVETSKQPYTDYFGVREDWLRIPKFGGGYLETVKRASFLGSDAVTVLPFDPATGNALVIRQFRHGAFVRGDANAWCLEPPAGRVDPGETPEDAAKRELSEEAGVEAKELHQVSAYYPSPGAYSEHLTSYVALCDLSGRDGQVMGLESEHEDIMSHVVPLDELAEMIATGAVNTGPLVLSIQWLLLNRDRFH